MRPSNELKASLSSSTNRVIVAVEVNVGHRLTENNEEDRNIP